MSDPSQRVAIVGIGAVFPGAPDPERFWALLAGRTDATTEVPPGRWLLDPAVAFDPHVATPDRVYSTRGGFIEGFRFDPEGLDLDPALAGRLDPMFHLALHAGRAAWRDARTDELDRSRVGVIFGNIVLPTETTSALTRETLGRTFAERVLGDRAALVDPTSDRPPTEPLNRFAAGLPAGLLARALGLGAGAFTLDAACASSLYALKLAADELHAGRADAMLTGGLSRPDPLYTQMGFSQLRALSPTGRARPFDGRGDGLIVGEGCGMFVLKRLDDALRQGDHVYAIVAAVGLSNDVDGGLLAPSSEGQLRAMRSAYERAGWTPGDVDLIECHATGTPVGDAVEFASLAALWGEEPAQASRCVIGSHKANIGHALTASGAAGLLKVLLALQYRTLPPTASFEATGPKIDLDSSPFRILTQPEPWNARAPGQPRRAAVSGFGFGGINAHALVEEWVPGETTDEISAIRTHPDETDSPIAIIGLGAHVGPFREVRAFQERILGGGEAAAPEPVRNDWGLFEARWARNEGLGPGPARGYHVDALAVPLDRFRIPPKELEEMLPQQILALLAAADAIADAGWKGEGPRLRAGVFVGIGLDLNTTNFHVRWSAEASARAWEEALGLRLDDAQHQAWIAALRDAAGPPLTANRTMGALGGLIASRIAREFHIGGPSFSVSSEETSGLKALEVGIRLLQQGELDDAVVGAVDLTGDPRIAVAARRAGIDPLTRGDGAVALVLKRLEDAQRDGNRVYAVIRGIGSASGGAIDTESAIELPHPTACARARCGDTTAFFQSWCPTGWTVTTSERREAHPDLHDCDDLRLPRAGKAPGPGGAVGHLGAASGLVALAGQVLALYQQIEPPRDGPMERVLPSFWLRDRGQGLRHATNDASGVAGDWFHVVLSEHEDQEAPQVVVERRAPLGARPRALFAIQGDTPGEILDRLNQLEVLAATFAGRPIEALARHWFATSPGEPGKRLGLAFTAGDPCELPGRLASARGRLADGDRSPVPSPRPDDAVFLTGDAPLGGPGRLALVYPGIGNPISKAGPALSVEWPEVFRNLDAGTLRLRSQLAPAGWDGPLPAGFADQRALILGQIAFGMAVTDLLAGFGVRPDAVLGYSLGESTALFATRAWNERDLMHERLDASPLFETELAGPCDAARRAWNLRPDEPVDWTAALVAADVESVRAAIRELGLSRVHPLIINAPGETVIGGQRTSVERVVEALSCLSLPLPVVSTVHCEIAREVEQAYRELHLLTTTPPPGVRFYSGAWGRSYAPDRATAAEAIVAQASGTVDFPALVRRAHDDGVRIFIEAGPGASCTRLIRAVLADRPHLAVAACDAGDDALTSVLDLLARLIAQRVPVDLQPLYGEPTRAVGLDSPAPPAPRRTIMVPVGGPAFDVPPALTPLAPASLPPSRPPIVEESPVPLQPGIGGSGPGALQTLPQPSGRLASVEEQAAADPLTAQLLATSAAEAEAHATYLRVAGNLGQTMADTVSFQLALLGSMMSGEAAGPSTVAAAPSTPAPVDIEATATAPEGKVVLDRAQCFEFAVGSIGKVLGEAFAAIDAYPTRVRLPDEPLMLVDRITAIEGAERSMTSGRVVTEHDVLPGDWYLDGGKIPPSIAIESGQADLFLSGWLGVDFETKGQAVYRLLDAAVTFHRGLPGPGAVIEYDIRISHFFRQGETILFRFEFDGTVDGAPLLTMRDGCAGFFSEAELSAGQGIVRRPLDLRPLPGKRSDDWREFVPMAIESFREAQVDALRRGDYALAFGPGFEGLGLADPLRLPGGRMTLVDRIGLLDPTGGRYGLGLIRSELDIHPGDWFLTCHFVDDRVMPGTLMYECCLHALRIYLMRLGWVAEAQGVAYEPLPGVASRLRCRGQVIESTSQAVFEVVIKELGYGPEPYAIADAMMYADGKAIVEVVDMTLRLTGLTREAIERVWERRGGAPRPQNSPAPALFTREQVLAFATGKPSEAFGARYRPFDEGRFIARLPAPPYSFLDRVVSTTAQPFVMKPGGEAVSEYDVPADAWYFAAQGGGVMPFAVLQEVSLQACGWLAAYMGSALTSDEDLAFRNLGGEAVALADVTPATGMLTTRVSATRVSHSGGMILQHYDFETCAGPVPVYRGATYFGFFRRAALADQVGIREATPYQPTADEQARARSFAYPADPPFPQGMLRMIDRVEAFVADGGPHGLGLVVGALDVDPSAWFFAAHFLGDPVCPGSLGLESFLQLLRVVALERWAGAAPAAEVTFEPVALGVTHRWLYRGQVVPADRTVTVQVVVTQVDDATRLVAADGFLLVDGRLIYQMNGFSLRLRIRD